MKIFQNRVIVAFLLILVSITNVYSQEDDPGFGFEGDPGEEPAAPIGDYVPIMLIAAIGLGYYVIKKNQVKEV